MNPTAEEIAQKLAKSLLQFNKSFMHMHRTGLQQNFAGCKGSEIGALFVIRHVTKAEEREIKVSEISKLMHVTSPTITQLLKGLETNGLIERHIDRTDRRVVGIALTERGEEVARQAEETQLHFLRGLIDYMGEEQSNELASLLFKASRYFNEKMSSMHQSLWNGEEDA
jgi:DNA-binding MarR family transcriptional regulator